jgi:hypothetical protein
MTSILRVSVMLVAAAFVPCRGEAQAHTSLAAEAGLAGANGKGGEFYPRDVVDARVSLGVRRWQSTRLGVFADVSMDWFGVGPRDICAVGSNGTCLDNYPPLQGPSAVFGIMARGMGQRVEMRAGLGGGAYSVNASRFGAAIGQLDAALFPLAHVGLVLDSRRIVVPNYRSGRLSVLLWGAGVRVR